MNDLFTRLAAAALTPQNGVRPRVPSLFEPPRPHAEASFELAVPPDDDSPASAPAAPRASPARPPAQPDSEAPRRSAQPALAEPETPPPGNARIGETAPETPAGELTPARHGQTLSRPQPDRDEPIESAPAPGSGVRRLGHSSQPVSQLEPEAGQAPSDMPFQDIAEGSVKLPGRTPGDGMAGDAGRVQPVALYAGPIGPRSPEGPAPAEAARPRREPPPPSPPRHAPVIRVTIGRIEVRAADPAAAQPLARPAAPAPKDTLRDYLERPKGARR